MNNDQKRLPKWLLESRVQSPVEKVLGEWSARWGRILDQSKAERHECAVVECSEQIAVDGLCVAHAFALHVRGETGERHGLG